MLTQSRKSLLIGAGFAAFAAMVIYSSGRSDELFIRALALGGLMVYFWILEIIPIYITALFPWIFAGSLGLITGDKGTPDVKILAQAYGNSMVFLFLGGFMLALALEKWNIHIQIAKGILRLVGHSKSRVILGFLLSTGLLSMWVSNTATALMLLPMALAVIKSMPARTDGKKEKFPMMLLLSIAYGSSIGGVGTLVGSPPNLQMALILREKFDIQIDFVQWFIVGFPVAILMIGLCYLYVLYVLGSERNEKLDQFSLTKEAWTSNQKKVLFVFLFVVIGWSFKDLIALLGFNYSDESIAILGTLMLFLVPAEKGINLLEWSDTKQLPWGILLLFGGGLALAQILDRGGVIDWMANSFNNFNSLPYFLVLLLFITIAIFATEIMSNLALVTLMVPIIARYAIENELSVLQICMSITLSASFAFMLPIGTPPNAIVFSSGHLSIAQMARTGFVLNLAGVLLVLLMSWFFL